MKMQRERVDSYDQLNSEEGVPAGQEGQARGKFGADMIVQNKGAGASEGQG